VAKVRRSLEANDISDGARAQLAISPRAAPAAAVGMPRTCPVLTRTVASRQFKGSLSTHAETLLFALQSATGAVSFQNIPDRFQSHTSLSSAFDYVLRFIGTGSSYC
jgi:hypothetical protein